MKDAWNQRLGLARLLDAIEKVEPETDSNNDVLEVIAMLTRIGELLSPAPMPMAA